MIRSQEKDIRSQKNVSADNQCQTREKDILLLQLYPRNHKEQMKMTTQFVSVQMKEKEKHNRHPRCVSMRIAIHDNSAQERRPSSLHQRTDMVRKVHEIFRILIFKFIQYDKTFKSNGQTG